MSKMEDFLKSKKSKFVESETNTNVEESVVQQSKPEDKLTISENDAKALRLFALDEDLSIPALVSLVLKSKTGKTIKESHVYDLQLRKLVDDNGEITADGDKFLESELTKKRIRKLLEE